MVEARHAVLDEAVARNAAIILSLPSAGMLRHHKSRFLGQAPDGIWVETAPGQESLIQQLLTTGETLGLSFKAGPIKVVFATTILRLDPQFPINAQTLVSALLVKPPDEIKQVQRRDNYRVHLRPDSGLITRIWRISEHAHLQDRPMAAQELPVQVRDISLGGMGVTFHAKKDQPLRICGEERLRIELTFGPTSMLIEGRVRHPCDETPQDTVRAGIQFRTLENDLDGRQHLAQLAKIVGELQREEIRRFRLGMTG